MKDLRNKEEDQVKDILDTCFSDGGLGTEALKVLDTLVLKRPRDLSLREIFFGMKDVEVEKLRPNVKEFVEKSKIKESEFAWILLKDVKDWKQVFELNSDWQGKNRKEMQNDRISGAANFYQAFFRWAKKEAAGDREKYESIVSQLFPRKSDFKKSEDKFNSWAINLLSKNE